MSLTPDTRLPPYRLVEKLGEGGMGEVWRGQDTSLGREAAIKVLPGTFAADPDRLARFEREARLLAALDHPNVAAVYGLHEHEGVRFIAMELVGGLDLARRLEAGPLPVDEAIDVARQVAAGLEAAHEQGVIHRDLKPANICIAADGKAKVLDFGLAKAMAPEGGDSDAGLSMSPTRTAGTMAGVVLGTASYMSPEQARGRPVDRRADIWAFGVVLHEMLTGRRLFTGETVSDVLAAVLRAGVRLDDLPADTPPAIGLLLARCLDRDPDRRLRDIGEARVVLERPEAAPAGAGAADTGAPARAASRAGLAALAVAALAVGAALGWALRPPPTAPPQETRRLLLAPPPGVAGPRQMPRLAPDGRAMAYLAGGRLWVHPLDRLTPRPVTGSEEATSFSWSPDGGSLAFAVGARLWRTELNGDPVRVAELPAPINGAGGLAWLDSQVLLFTTGQDSLYEVPVTGGTPRVVLAPDPATEEDFHNPAPLPEGLGVLFLTHRKIEGTDTLEALVGDRRTVLFQEAGASLDEPVYDAFSGRVLFARSDSNPGIWALPVRLPALDVTGPPELITSEGSSPSTSAAGALLYANRVPAGDQRLALVGFGGDEVREASRPLNHADNVTFSPDGQRLAACVFQGTSTDLWVFDLERRTETRLVQQAGCGSRSGGLSWTPDGTALAYGDRSREEIRLHRADGAVKEEVLARGLEPSLGPDGRWLALVRSSPETGKDIWIQPLGDAGPATAFQATEAEEEEPRISPGGRLMAFVSDQSGTSSLYLRPFPSGEGMWQVSGGNGEKPRWSADGSRLYYLEDNARIMQVEVQQGPTLSLGVPREAVSAQALRLGPEHGYDIAPDGTGLVTVQLGGNEPGHGDLTLELGWTVGGLD